MSRICDVCLESWGITTFNHVMCNQCLQYDEMTPKKINYHNSKILASKAITTIPKMRELLGRAATKLQDQAGDMNDSLAMEIYKFLEEK